MDDYFDLGHYSRAITTTSPEAQLWFDRGLNWSYGFNHQEALHCYQKVIEHDPNCAMGYWGMAYAIGPYYNLTWPDYSDNGQKEGLEQTFTYIREAQQRMAEATPVEQALINALAVRFPAKSVTDEAVFAQWDDDYATAMRQVYAQFPDDYDVCALTAEALMCRTPWQLWDLERRVPADGADTRDVIDILETALALVETRGDQPHPGLLHFYIHAREMSPEPERALPACDTLLHLVPDSGHLVHMPSHVYILCGLYQEAFDSNAAAMVADYKFEAYDNSLGLYTIYRLHNIHFKIYAAIFLGQYEAALEACEVLAALIPPEGLHNEQAYIVNYLEGYAGMKAHVYIRFGKWQEIKDEPLPADPELYCVTTTLWHYAKGVAYAATGDIKNAVLAQQQFLAALATVPEQRLVFNNECRDTLAVGEAMLAGELEYRRQNYDVAFKHLRIAVARYDDLNYTEPWAWMQPPRHALGALLLEQGHVDDAALVYRADLGLDDTLVRPSQHPDNLWSLHGYAECLRLLNRTEEAAEIQTKLEQAQATADITIHASCFCRQHNECCD
ncbi:MAG: hypothetical protein AAF485_20455 [Chloroflexota bacterium]